MSFLNTPGFLALFLVPPLLLLYILKFRRQRRVVASAMLWQQVMADMRANTPFQKLRRNLLLLLQIIILALLALALAAPVIYASLTAEKKFVIVIIDSSAGMQSTDAGGARLEAARREARILIDSLPADSEVMVIDAGGQPSVVGNFTPDHSLSRRAVDEIDARDCEGKLADAVALAYNNLMGMRSKGDNGSAPPPGEIYLFSDGGNLSLPALEGLGSMMRYIKIGERGNNIGISGFYAGLLPREKGKPPSFTVSVRVTNACGAARSVILTLRSANGNRLVDSKAVTVPAGESQFVYFEGKQFDFPDDGPVRLTAQIEFSSGEKDDLPVDNVAYSVIHRPRALQALLVTEGSPAIERYFEINNDTAVTLVGHGEYEGSMAAQADLVVFDHFVPDVLPDCDCLFIEPTTTLDRKTELEEVISPPVNDWAQQDSLLECVRFDDLTIITGHPFPVREGDEALLRSKKGALILRRSRGEAAYVIVAFDPHFSNWKADPSYVIFMDNLVNGVMARRQIGAARGFKAGEPIEFVGNPGRVSDSEVTAPDGHRPALTATEGRLYLYDTSKAGFYTATIYARDGRPRRRDFGVSTVSVNESMNAPLEKMAVGEDEEVQALTVSRSNLELWPLLALLAAVVMLVEWWAFHKKS
jgi:hypothetical protein